MIQKLVKLTVALVVCIISSNTSKAQIVKPSVTLGVNAVYSMPKGDFKNNFKFGVGGEVYAGVGLGKTYLMGTLGYRAFREDASLNAGTLTYTPVKVGIRQYFLMKRIFVQGDLGIANVKYAGQTWSAFAPGVGAGVRLLGLELGLYVDAFKLNSSEKYANTLNAKAGYSFSL